MKTLLYHKLEFDGKTYYQCEFVVDNFIKSGKFDEFSNRKESDKKDFYIEVPDDKVDKDALHKIYREDDTLVEVTESPEILIVSSLFDQEMKKILNTTADVRSLTPTIYKNKYLEVITRDVAYQDDAVKDVIDTILLNGYIAKSDMSDDQKRENHENVILYGPPGCGKKTLMNSLKNNMVVPVASAMITEDIQGMINSIAGQLVKHRSDDYNRGIVLLNSHYADVELLQKTLQTFSYARFIYNDSENNIRIDFNNLTFIVNIDVPYADLEEMSEVISDTFGFKRAIPFNPLTFEEQKNILLTNKHSYLLLYQKIAGIYGKNIKVSDTALNLLIESANNIGRGLDVVQTCIGNVLKDQIKNGDDELVVGHNVLSYFVENYAMDELPKDKDDIPFKEKVNEIASEISKTVRGQDEQIKTIVRRVLRNQNAIDNPDDFDNMKQNIFLRGDSGTGKTEIIKQLKKYLDVPVLIVDATKYTEEGYHGKSVDEIVKILLKMTDGDIDLAKRAVIYLDEIDKKAMDKGRDSDVSRGSVQDAFLTMVQGDEIDVNLGTEIEPDIMRFDTSNLTFISGGAFEGIEDICKERIKKQRAGKIGFGNYVEIDEKDIVVSVQDFETFGMKKQFTARHPEIVELNKLGVEDLCDIMKNSHESALKKCVVEYKRDEGIDIEYSEDFYHAFAEKVLKLKVGARGIEQALSQLFKELKIYDVDTDKYNKVILNKDCIDNPEKLILVEKKRKSRNTRTKVKKLV